MADQIDYVRDDLAFYRRRLDSAERATIEGRAADPETLRTSTIPRLRLRVRELEDDLARREEEEEERCT